MLGAARQHLVGRHVDEAEIGDHEAEESGVGVDVGLRVRIDVRRSIQRGAQGHALRQQAVQIAHARRASDAGLGRGLAGEQQFMREQHLSDSAAAGQTSSEAPLWCWQQGNEKRRVEEIQIAWGLVEVVAAGFGNAPDPGSPLDDVEIQLEQAHRGHSPMQPACEQHFADLPHDRSGRRQIQIARELLRQRAGAADDPPCPHCVLQRQPRSRPVHAAMLQEPGILGSDQGRDHHWRNVAHLCPSAACGDLCLAEPSHVAGDDRIDACQFRQARDIDRLDGRPLDRRHRRGRGVRVSG